MASPAAVLIITVNANTTAANAALARTQAELKATATTSETAAARTGASWSKAGKTMSTVGKSMTKYITVPVIAIGAASAKLAMDFDKSMAVIQTQAGASAKEVEALHTEVLDFAESGKTQFSPNELAQALYSIESAGIHGAKAMDTLKASSKLAMVGQADLASTTKALAAAQKTGIKGSADLKKAIGTLNGTVGAGQMKMDDLVAAMGTGFLASARQMGLSLSDVGAALAELTKQGVPANAAATRLRMAFTLMAAPTDAAKSALASIGLDATDLATAMRGKGGIVDAIQLLHDHLDGLSHIEQTQLLSAAFGGARSGGTIMALNSNVDDLAKTLGVVKDNSDKVGQSFHKIQTDPEVRLKETWSALQAVLIKLGNDILPKMIPLVKRFASAFEGVLKVFMAMPSWMQEFLLGAVVAGPFLRMAGGLIKVASAAKAAAISMGLLGAATGGSAAAGGATTAAEGGVAGGALAAGTRLAGLLKVARGGAVITTLVASLKQLSTNANKSSDDFKTSTDAIATGLQNFNMGPLKIGDLMEKVSIPEIGAASLTPAETAARALQKRLDNTEAFGHATAASKELTQQLARQAGLTNNARDNLRKYLHTIDTFPIGGGPIDWLNHMSKLQNASMTTTDKNRKAMIKQAKEAQKSGEINKQQMARIIQTIKLAGQTLGPMWNKAMDQLPKGAQKAAAAAHKPLAEAFNQLRKSYGSLTNAGRQMTKAQRQNWIDMATAAVNHGQITAKQFDKIKHAMGSAKKDWNKNLKSMSKATGESKKQISHDIGGLDAQVSKEYPHMLQIGKKSTGALVSTTKTSTRSIKNDNLDRMHSFQTTATDTSKQNQKVVKSTKDTHDKVTHTTDDQTKKVKADYGNLNQGVADALRKLQDATNTALKALGVKSLVNFTAGVAGGGPAKKRRGGVIGGTGSGDRVHALLEPGEFVVNREAVKGIGAHRLDAMNNALPRFRKGGAVGGLSMLSGDVDEPKLDPILQKLATAAHQAIFIQDGGRTLAEQAARYNASLHGGNVAAAPTSSAPHVMGIAADITPGQEVFGKLAPKFGLGFPVPGEPWHIQIMDPGATGTVGAVWKDIKRVILNGPPGAMRDTGQGVADKVWKAANAFGRKKASKLTAGAGSNIAVGPGALSRGEMRKLIKAHNLPDIAGWIAYAESGFNPKALNASSGASGLWQFLPSTWAGLGVPGSPFDPNSAAVGFGKLYGQSGTGPWAASQSSGVGGGWGQHVGQPFRRGGAVRMPPFAGSFQHGGMVPGPTGSPRTIVAHGGEQVSSGRKRYAITITNWKQGTGYMEEIADNVSNGQRRLGNQLSRMSRA